MKIIITGALGFIGSNLVKKINELGYFDLTLVDDESSDKINNIKGLKYLELVPINDFIKSLKNYKNYDVIFHLGAISSTTEQDENIFKKYNLDYSSALLNFSLTNHIPLIYASSAATYGDGSVGFLDEISPLDLYPLNPYGRSKNDFDKIVVTSDLTSQVVGLKFFNVYGPNEAHKNSMASMIYHGFNQISKKGCISLFKSTKEGLFDGEQCRDFVYVDDVIDVMIFMMNHPEISGLFNVGTGHARSFNDLARAIFTTLDKPVNIKYIDMPLELSKQYQNFTEANLNKLRSVGYTNKFHTLEEGVKDYITNYLLG